jgi:hypothetical protein
MKYELPSAPLSIGGVIDHAIRLYRDSIRRSWIVALLYSLVVGAFTLVWVLALTKAAVPGNKDPMQALALMFSPTTIATFVVGVLVSMTFYGALMKTISAWAQGDESLTLGQALAVGVRRLPGVLLGSLIYSLAIAVGFVLLFVPGIYFFGKLQLWMAAMFMEDTKATDALEISWRLTKGRWWRGTIILSVALIMLYVFALAFGLISGAITAVAHLGVTDRLIINQAFSLVSNMIVLPMFVAILIVMYHDFKLRGEGGDLAARMGALGKV